MPVKNNVELNIKATDQSAQAFNSIQKRLSKLDNSSKKTNENMTQMGSGIKFGAIAASASVVFAGAMLAAGKALKDFLEVSESIEIVSNQVERLGLESELSRQQIQNLGISIGSLTDANDITRTLLNSDAISQFKGELTEIIVLLDNQSKETGKSAKKVALLLARTFDNTEKSLSGLNGALNLFSAEQERAIITLSKTGQQGLANATILQTIKEIYGAINVNDTAVSYRSLDAATDALSINLGRLIAIPLEPFVKDLARVAQELANILDPSDSKILDNQLRTVEAQIISIRNTLVDLNTGFAKGGGILGGKIIIKDKKRIIELNEELKNLIKTRTLLREEAQSPRGRVNRDNPDAPKLPDLIDPDVIKPLKININQGALDAAIKVASRSLQSLHDKSVKLLSQDEQLEIKRNTMFVTARQLAEKNINAETLKIKIRGRNGFEFTQSEIDNIDRLNARRIQNISDLNQLTAREIAIFRQTENFSDIEEAFLDARLSAINNFETAKTKIQQNGLDRFRAGNIIDAEILTEQQETQLMSLEAHIEAQNALWLTLKDGGIDIVSNAFSDMLLNQEVNFSNLKQSVSDLGEALLRQSISTIARMSLEHTISEAFKKKALASEVAANAVRVSTGAPAAIIGSIASGGTSATAGIISMTSATVAGIALLSSLEGSFESGTSNILPRNGNSGIFELHRNERVVNAADNKKLTKMLDNNTSEKSEVININMPLSIEIKAIDTRDFIDRLEDVQETIQTMANEGLNQAMRQRGQRR